MEAMSPALPNTPGGHATNGRTIAAYEERMDSLTTVLEKTLEDSAQVKALVAISHERLESLVEAARRGEIVSAAAAREKELLTRAIDEVARHDGP